jgi:serine protease AprX
MACAPGADNPYRAKSGTSMSTPMISGAIALLLEKNPSLTNLEIKKRLKESTIDMGFDRNQQGWGKFDCDRFLLS